MDVSAINGATKYGEEAIAFCEEVLESAWFALVDRANGAIGDVELCVTAD
jgi:hypothetical protein